MKYYSTRDKNKSGGVSAAEAILRGLAPDKGLYMPEAIPQLTADNLNALTKMTYPQRAADILARFLTDYDPAALLEDAEAAYGERFPGGAAPVVGIGEDVHVLELWHGPTCAFKDMALQIMPRLLSRALAMTGEKRTAHILVATSGDTGKAALEGYRDVPGVKIPVFYPVDGVSAMQKRQMTTQLGANVRVAAVRGNFDDAQNGVKAIFADAELAARAERDGFFFSSANSINWGRLAPQIVYYVSAYCDLVARGAIRMGDRIPVCVPTGNFGDIFAGYIAKVMGLPLGTLICASNANRVLTDFFATGTYDRERPFFKTISPSMDILISSNLERLLYLAAGPEKTAGYMEALAANGKYRVDDDVLRTLQSEFKGYCCDENETKAQLAASFRAGYLCDPHTAVGLGAVRKYRAETGDRGPILSLSTASTYKFAGAVLDALGAAPAADDPAALLNALNRISGIEVPAPLAAALTLPIRFSEVVAPEEMPDVVFR